MKKSFFLLILILLLSSTLYLRSPEKNLSTTSEETDVKIFTSSCVKAANRIKLISPNLSQELIRAKEIESEDLLIKRSKWLLKEPFLAPANDSKVSSLLDLFSNLSGQDSKNAPEASKQAEYGLTPPEAVLIVECGDSKEVISIGSKNAITSNRYFQKEGQTSLLLIKDNFYEDTIALISNIRAKKILGFNPNDIQGIEVIEGDNFFSLIKGDDSHWTIKSPGETIPGDQNLISREVTDLVNIEITRIFDNPLEILPLTGLEKPRLILNLKFKDREESGNSKELILQFGKGLLGDLINKTKQDSSTIKQPYYLKITKDNSIYELESSYISDWLQGPRYFHTRTPLSNIRISNFKNISLQNKIKSCSLSNSDIVNSRNLNNSLNTILHNIQFDALLDQDELSQYKKTDGISINLQDQLTIHSIKVVAALGDGSLEQSPAVILEYISIGKNPIYGILSSSRLNEIDKELLNICAQGAGR